MSSGRIGAVELTAGVPFPSWALEILRHSVNNEHFQEVVYLGRSYEPGEARTTGLVDEVVTDGELIERALDVGRRLGRVPRRTFALTKQAVRRATVEAADAGAAATDEDVKAAWNSPEVQEAIRAQLRRLGAS
jgi:enoyl-CoA hydratase